MDAPKEVAVIEPRPTAELAVETVGIDALVERVELIKRTMRECMQEGLHCGTIPGTKKPSL